MTEIWLNKRKIVIINLYNPYKKLKIEELENLDQGNQVIWCGDFNAHNTLWGGKSTDYNGQIVEELIETEGLVCLNNGQGTRLNFSNGVESAVDLTLVSSDLAGASYWEVLNDNIIGSDHYPIGITFEMNNSVQLDGIRRWSVSKADWGKFTSCCDEEFSKIVMSEQIDEVNTSITTAIVKGASQAIGKSTSKKKIKMVPWWNKECSEAIKQRNRTFRELKRSHSFYNLLEYKQTQAIVQKTVKRANKSSSERILFNYRKNNTIR